jgi:lipid A 3-O-deacylase
MRTGFMLLWFAILSGYGQSAPLQFGVVTDNDLYTSLKYDRYYTSGLEFYFRYLNKTTNPSVNKRITEFRIGQYIYNPSTRNADNPVDNDRPFAGYLFGEAGMDWFYHNESVLKSSIQLGYVGPNSFSEETQRLIHDIFGYKKVLGWQHQIRNTLAVQTGLLYSVKVLPQAFSDVDFHVQADFNLGTAFTGATLGWLTRIGLEQLLPIYDSNMHGASINAKKDVYKDQTEKYIYVMPAINYQLYDASIQGSLFNDESPITYDLIPVRFQGELGIKYRRNNWDFAYAIVYRGKEAKNNAISGYYFGSIHIGYILN